MKFSNAIVGVTAMLISISAPLWSKSEEKLSNSEVHAVEYRLAPGESVPVAPKYPSVFVVIAGDKAELGFANGSKQVAELKRGMTVAEAAGWSALTNKGTSPIDLVRIEFLTSGLDKTWGMTGLPPAYKVLLEDRYNRSYEIRIPANSFEPQHTHHDRVVVCLDGAMLEHIYPDGTKKPSTLHSGEVAWRLGETHTGHNLGTTDLWVVAVEPK